MSRKKRTSCPFWSITDRKCNIALDGLFIPPDDHIKMFCKTADHPLCPQYSGQMSEEVAFYTCVAERRRHHRIINAQQITVIKPEKIDNESRVHFLATTIDMSISGMRLFSKEPLPEDSVVSLSFDESFPKHLRSSKAIIKWCLPQLNYSGFQAGLAFTEDESSKAMNSYLNPAQP